MARYDRIATIPPPRREDTFAGWMTLRDLTGRERDQQLGRRARLRFLALRPVQRLLRRGLSGVSARSLGMQVDSVRNELSFLSADDPERDRLMAYLAEVGGRTPAGLVNATLDVGGSAEAAGHTYAAEEFYRTGLEITRLHDLTELGIRSLRRLGRIHLARGEWDAAIDFYDRSAILAEASGDLVGWARGRRGIAAVRSCMGDAEEARWILDAVATRGRDEAAPMVEAMAAAGRCTLERHEGELEAAVEAGWAALQLMDEDEEPRNAVLLEMASCFRRMGLRSAAEASYEIVAVRSAWPEHRMEARVEHAVVAAEMDSVEAFRSRRDWLLEGQAPGDPHLACLLHLGLGHGCMAIGDHAEARHHLRQAISTARDAGLDTMLTRAEALLSALERNAGVTGPPRARVPAPEAARRIARDVESLGEALVQQD